MFISNTTGGLMLQTMLYLANHTTRTAVDRSNELLAVTASDSNEVKCYGVYGCFPLNGPWTTNTRRINVHPQKPSEIGVRFILHTTEANDKPKNIDLNEPEALQHMGINPKGKLFFIAHGYLETADIDWMPELCQMLLRYEPEGQAAVILIDWGNGSSPPYVQAVANIRLVGAITAHVMHMIYEELSFTDSSKIHIIGHSLGSHLAGYAGYHLQKDFGLKVGRITGLDPAAPLFAETHGVVRLDRSDAHFVDIIHTDGNLLGGLGLYQRLGHVDFYPNGGMDNPGCDGRLQEYMRNSENTIIENMQKFVGCNHVRSYQYFIESIRSNCPFMGVTCNSYQSFKAGRCSCFNENAHLCMRMGYHSYEDYRHHYKITVRVAGHEESISHGGEVGTISIRLHGKNREESTESMKFSTKPIYFEPGLEYTSLVAGQSIKNPAYAAVSWEYETSLFNPLTWRILASPRIYISYIFIEPMETPHTYLKLCPINDTCALIAGNENIMQTKYC
uniref:Lipase domain-containing protein n=1 Tax=Glossina morsitans morsitans TaxID=37546 RepID=A0A1B0FEN7_GLOMM